MRRLMMAAAVCVGLGMVAGAAERENQGVYGANPSGIAYDAVNKVMFTTAQCALTCFASRDSGKTWAGAFPVESLTVIRGTDTIGWGGGATGVVSHSGTTIVKCKEESGTRWSTAVTFNGGTLWRTLFDRGNWASWLSGRCTETHVTALTGVAAPEIVTTYAGRIYVVVKQFIFWTGNQGTSWNVMRFPDSSMAAAGLAQSDTALRIFDLTFFGASGDSFYVVATGQSYWARDSLPARMTYQYIKSLYVTRDAGRTFQFTMSPSDPQVLYEGTCTPAPCTTSAFNIHHVACTPSGDTIFLQSGAADGSSINFGKLNTDGVTCVVSIDKGVTWKLMFKESTNNNLGYMSLFCDPALPTGMRLFLGSSRYTDAAQPGIPWEQPDSVGYGEMNQTPSVMNIMFPGAQVWAGLSPVGPFVTTKGIDSRFYLRIDGLEAVKIYKISQVPTQLDTVFLATHMGLAATKAYTDASVSYANKWKSPNGVYGLLNGECKLVAINPNDPSLVVAVGMNGFKVTNGTGSIFEAGGWDDKKISATQNTPNGGVTYVYVTGLDSAKWANGGGMITGLAFVGKDTVLASFTAARNVIYGGLMQSFDRGQTWAVNTNVPDSVANDVAVSRDAAGNTAIIVAMGTERNNPSWGYMMKSTGNLTSWTRLAPKVKNLNGQTQNQVPAVNAIEFAPGRIDTAYMIWGRFPAATVNGFDTVMVFNNMPQINSNQSGMTNIAVNKNAHDSAFFAHGKIIWAIDVSYEASDGKGGTTKTPVIGQYFNSLPGEVIYDVLFDDLTMSSSTGFYAVEQSHITRVTPRVALATRPLTLAALGTAGTRPTLQFNLPGAGHIKLSLFDMRGRSVARLVDGMGEAGIHTVNVDRNRVSTGVYVARLEWKNKRAVTSFTIAR